MRGRLATWLLLAAPVFGVDGTVVNRTTGQPAGGTMISLYKLGQGGMEPVATVKTDDQGKFQISKDVEGPRLLQTIFDGVVYSQMLPPGSSPAGLTVEVYNTSKKPVDVAQHFLFLQPSGNLMTINEVFIFRNEGKETFSDGATLKFFAPEGVQEMAVRATAPGGMPVDRPAAKFKDGYKVDFPIKPGETRFEISYRMPYSSGMEYPGRSLDGSKIETMLLAPQGVTLEGVGLVAKGQEPSTRATVYAISSPSYRVKVAGEAAAMSESASTGPEIEQIAPKILERGSVILGLALGILALGFVLLYRKSQEGHEQRGRG